MGRTGNVDVLYCLWQHTVHGMRHMVYSKWYVVDDNYVACCIRYNGIGAFLVGGSCRLIEDSQQ
jgi:hypothetical protein